MKPNGTIFFTALRLRLSSTPWHSIMSLFYMSQSLRQSKESINNNAEVEEAVLHRSGKSVKHGQLSTFNHQF